MPTMTITTTVGNAVRLAEAVGSILGLKDVNGNPRNATEAEIKTWTITGWRLKVLAYEKRKAEAAALATVPEPISFDPT